jgi:hypothetical protein
VVSDGVLRELGVLSGFDRLLHFTAFRRAAKDQDGGVLYPTNLFRCRRFSCFSGGDGHQPAAERRERFRWT